MTRQSSKELMQQPCMPCTGRGYTTCTICGGAGGTSLSKSRLGSGGQLEFYQERVPCTICFGTGRVTCPSCQGVGWVLAKGTASGPPEVRPPQPNPAPPANPGPAAPSSSASQPFPFQDYQFVHHPSHGDVWADWQHNPSNVLDVGWASTNTRRIDVAACQGGKWLPVVAEGQTLPLEIFVGIQGELLGRWLL